MKKTFRHGGAIMLVAVFALGLLGAAYTLWYEDLTLHADVTTGTFDADVSIHPWDGQNFGPGQAIDDTYPGAGRPVVGIIGPGPYASPSTIMGQTGGYDVFGDFPPGKPPTVCDAAIQTVTGAQGAPPQANDATDSNALVLTLSGLYPFTGCEYTIDIHNSGTVPFHIGLTGATLEKCDAQGQNCGPTVDGVAPWSIGLDPDQPQLAQCVAFLGALYPVPQFNQEITLGPQGPALQVHDGEEILCRFKLILDEYEDLSPYSDVTDENAVYRFSATYKTYQWNENPFGP